MEQEERREEREFQLRRELELKKLELELEALQLRHREVQRATNIAPPGGLDGRASSLTFNISCHISLVPAFRETEVEAYFGIFERIAAALNWPVNMWAILLQCKLFGKAREACSALSVEDGLDYDKVKTAILRAYELVPEAYRQRFRSLRKLPSQSYIDFAREKGILFDPWCSSCKANDWALVCELMLLEEFKNCLPERTATYLNEQKVTTLQQASTLAGEFALTHKTVFVRRNPTVVPPKSDRQVRNSNSLGSTRDSRDRQCFYSRKTGHLIADCEAWNQKQKSVPQQPKGVGLIGVSPPKSPDPLASEVPDSFKPFTFDGFVSLTGKTEDQRPVTILRDTVCSQSLILSHVLPSGLQSEVSTVVQGIEMGFLPAPLHYIHVASSIATGL